MLLDVLLIHVPECSLSLMAVSLTGSKAAWTSLDEELKMQNMTGGLMCSGAALWEMKESVFSQLAPFRRIVSKERIFASAAFSFQVIYETSLNENLVKGTLVSSRNWCLTLKTQIWLVLVLFQSFLEITYNKSYCTETQHLTSSHLVKWQVNITYEIKVELSE